MARTTTGNQASLLDRVGGDGPARPMPSLSVYSAPTERQGEATIIEPLPDEGMVQVTSVGEASRLTASQAFHLAACIHAAACQIPLPKLGGDKA